MASAAGLVLVLVLAAGVWFVNRPAPAADEPATAPAEPIPAPVPDAGPPPADAAPTALPPPAQTQPSLPPPASAAPAGLPAKVPAGPPAADAPRPAPVRPPDGPFQSTEVDIPPKVLTQVAPEYPESAKRRKLQDTVVLSVLVSKTGAVTDVRYLRRSQKDPAFNDAAATAVRQWTFTPARLMGRPVACWFNIGVPFGRRR
jgi:protein TonB